MEIERIYVLKEYHGHKIGQLLFEKAISIAKSMEKKYVWLGVWEKNERAIAFYTKNGFTVVDHHLFKLGDDVQTDYLMKRML
jgi:ribosomal protein S18 acetylase RimI-like enzyme